MPGTALGNPQGAPVGGFHPLPPSAVWPRALGTMWAHKTSLSPSHHSLPQRGRGHVTPKTSPSQGDPPFGNGSKSGPPGAPGPEKTQVTQPGCCLGHGHPGFPPAAEHQGLGLPKPYFKYKGTQAPGHGWGRCP